jgi:hypothetical protein
VEASRPRRPAWCRIITATIGVAVALGAASAASPAGASDAASAGRFLALTNDARGGIGLPDLVVSGDLAGLADVHAGRMAAASSIFHPDLDGLVSGGIVVAANVGRGPTVELVQEMFLGSSIHRGNILDSRFSHVGIGVAWQGSDLYVVEIFRQPAAIAARTTAAASSPPPAVAPRRSVTTSAPAPAASPTTMAPPPPTSIAPLPPTSQVAFTDTTSPARTPSVGRAPLRAVPKSPDRVLAILASTAVALGLCAVAFVTVLGRLQPKPSVVSGAAHRTMHD